jgi:hypothetical protein
MDADGIVSVRATLLGFTWNTISRAEPAIFRRRGSAWNAAAPQFDDCAIEHDDR